jgi:sulfite exporter TauE/SafE
VTGQFLFGRLLGYLLFAVLTWTFSSAILQETGQRNLIIGIAYILFSCLLIFYGFFKKTNASCKAACDSNKYKLLLDFWPSFLPVAAGFASGLNFCPPFLLAFTGAIEQTNLLAAILFFFSFFLGTSLLFVLAPFVGMFKRFQVLQIIGKMAAGLMGFYYLYSGFILIIGGLKIV